MRYKNHPNQNKRTKSRKKPNRIKRSRNTTRSVTAAAKIQTERVVPGLLEPLKWVESMREGENESPQGE